MSRGRRLSEVRRGRTVSAPPYSLKRGHPPVCVASGLLLAFLALLLLLSPAALLLAFLALLLFSSAAGEPPYDALGLVSHTSYGVLRPLDGLPRLVSHLACGFLHPSALLLLLLLLVLLVSSTLGLGGARRLLGGLLGLGGRGDLEIEEAPVGTKLQADEGTRLVLDGARRLPLLVGGPLRVLCPRQIRDVAHYLLGDRVALLIDSFLDDVALLVDGALDGLPLFVGGGLAEQLGTGGDVLGYLASLIDCLPRGVLNLPGCLPCGVLCPLHGLSGLIGYASEGTTTLLLLALLVTFAHFFLPSVRVIGQLLRSETPLSPGSDRCEAWFALRPPTISTPGSAG